MMKIDKVVKKETGFIILGQIVFCAVLLIIYFLASKITWEVSVGALVGSLLAILNFFITGITVQKSLTCSEENKVKMTRASQGTRFIVIAIIIILCLTIPKLDPIATLLPLFFPRITIIFRSEIIKRRSK